MATEVRVIKGGPNARLVLCIGCFVASFVLTFLGHRYDVYTTPGMPERVAWNALPWLLRLTIVAGYLCFVTGIAIVIVKIKDLVKRHAF